jgi:hypothetical protein
MSIPGIVIELQKLRTDNKSLCKELTRMKRREIKLQEIIDFTSKFVLTKDLRSKLELMKMEANLS